MIKKMSQVPSRGPGSGMSGLDGPISVSAARAAAAGQAGGREAMGGDDHDEANTIFRFHLCNLAGSRLTGLRSG